LKGCGQGSSILVAGVVAVLALAALVALYYPRPSQLSQACSSVIGQNSIVEQPGYSYACGAGQASDGRLMVTFHGYRFSTAKEIDFVYGKNQAHLFPSEVILLVNATITNVGGGNVSIGGGWFAWVRNGSDWAPVSNIILNASFPGTHPRLSIPDSNGGLYLAPNARADLGLMFYVSFGPSPKGSDLNETSAFRLEYLTFNENSYGGTYLGGGAYVCKSVACPNPDTELIVET